MTSVETQNSTRWQELSQRVLSGTPMARAEGFEILRSKDSELLELLSATYTVRQTYFANKVQLYYLKNAKSGLCPEDCGYCSQSIISDAPIEKYSIANERVLLEGAQKASETQARTYCIVASGRGPTDREVDHVCDVVQKIKNEHGLHICACLGLLKPDQAKRLADAGVDRINHNLNTSRRYYEEICTTHTYQDRLDTL
ncbi:MAG: radical SAM protein, partial [Planctomicrobium sp.]|nr:radical SAM protein [Planctomicrobium sp.]